MRGASCFDNVLARSSSETSRTWQVLREVCVALILAAGVALVSSTARADEYTDKLNEPLARIPAERRAETILLPLLANLQTPPRVVEDRSRAMLMQPSFVGWSDANAWAQAPSQRAILDGLALITKEENPLKAHVFALGYGAEATPRQAVRDKLYIELGDPPTIAAAELHYLPSLDRMVTLIHVEAARLASEGKVPDAVDLLINSAHFGRIMMDRPLMRESKWGIDLMSESMERIRDILYVDTRTVRSMQLDRVQIQIKRMSVENSFLDFSRTKVPLGDVLGVSQVVSRVYKQDGKVDDRTFAQTLARLGSVEYPLRLFSEASRWKALESGQSDRFACEQIIRGVNADFTRRWQIDWWDRHMGTPSELDNVNREKFSAISASIKDQRPILDALQIARIEIGGTRTNLALVAQWYNTKNMPTSIALIRPRWVDKLDIDYFDASRLSGSFPRFQFVIPMTDRRGLRAGEQAAPLDMSVVPKMGAPFSVPLRDDVWVVYSVGSDTQANGARRVQNTATKVQNADYLIWPPMLSLYRQNLVDLGDLK